MASKVIKGPFIRQVAIRGYAKAEAAGSTDAGISACVTPQKTIIAALNSISPLTRVTVAFKAGSRYEPQSELGISHVLRSAAGLSTKKSSGFIIQRKLAQLGASVSASGDREFIYYTLEATQQHALQALEYFNNLISCQEFRPWELEDNVPRLRYDIATLTPQVRAVDLLHKAAFRRGLGNSLFVSPRRISAISSESLQHYAGSCLKPNHCAITVVGDSVDKAALISQALQLYSSPDLKSEHSTYFGGEIRKEIGGDLAHVALALSGAPAGSTNAIAFAIIAKAIGNGPLIKWGSYNSGLVKAIGGNIGPYAAAGFNVSYSDAGLFGVILTVPKDEAYNAVKNTAAYLKDGIKLSPKEISAAKNQLKLQILNEADDGSSLAESIAAQCLTTGKAKSPLELAAAINSIPDSEISEVLANARKSKFAMASVGNLAFVPYLDEL